MAAAGMRGGGGRGLRDLIVCKDMMFSNDPGRPSLLSELAMSRVPYLPVMILLCMIQYEYPYYLVVVVKCLAALLPTIPTRIASCSGREPCRSSSQSL